MIRQVYIGAAEYEAGAPVPLEQAIADQTVCQRLRASHHGARLFRWHDGDIFGLVDPAVQKTLAASGLRTADVDAVFLVSNLLDAQNNLAPAWLGAMNARLGLGHAVHYHVGIVGCGGFHWAARLAASLIAADQCDNILLVSFDQAGGNLQRLYGQGTGFSYVTGDAAAACVLSSSADRLDYVLRGKIVNHYDGAQIVHPSMDSEMRCIARLVKQTYALAKVGAGDIDAFITNNYSLDASRLYCQLANLDFSKAYTDTIATHAHCFGSDNIINLHHVTSGGDLRDGANVLLFSTGPFQWGACILQKISYSERKA